MRHVRNNYIVPLIMLMVATAGGCGADSPSAPQDRASGVETNAPKGTSPQPDATGVPTSAPGGGHAPNQAAAATSPERQGVGGKDIFRLYCAACHGATGTGTPQGPALTKASQSLAAGGGERDLRRRLSAGGDRMPAFPFLGDREIDAVVDYLRELGGGPPAPSVSLPSFSGRPLGEGIYTSNCAVCHDPKRTNASRMMCQPASLAGATERFSRQQVMTLLDVGVGPMPAFDHLTTEERDALWAYLGTLSGDSKDGPTMRRTCPMVVAAMEGRPMGKMMRNRRGKQGRGSRWRSKMSDEGMMGGEMMGEEMMSCPMLTPSVDADERPPGSSPTAPLPPCCT